MVKLTSVIYTCNTFYTRLIPISTIQKNDEVEIDKVLLRYNTLLCNDHDNNIYRRNVRTAQRCSTMDYFATA